MANNISLQQHLQTAIRAYYWTSFDPEKRGASTLAGCEKMLNSDLQSVPENYQEKYIDKFTSKMLAWLHSESNCASSMIAGPARFPVQKMRKRRGWADNHYNEFMTWRKRVISKIQRSENKRNGPTELEKAVNDLAACKKNHETMKAANAIIRKAKGSDTCIPDLIALGIKEIDAHQLLHPKFDYYGKGYQTFYLTNNNANIKRLEERVKMLQSKEQMKEKIEAGAATPEITINGAIIRQDFADDRLKIIFDGKPAQNVINALKSSGFRWSPFLKCWCRKLTNDAGHAAKRICKTELQPVAA